MAVKSLRMLGALGAQIRNEPFTTKPRYQHLSSVVCSYLTIDDTALCYLSDVHACNPVLSPVEKVCVLWWQSCIHGVNTGELSIPGGGPASSTKPIWGPTSSEGCLRILFTKFMPGQGNTRLIKASDSFSLTGAQNNFD